MKIAVLGYSGSGKSTLARRLGETLGLPVLHMDSVHFLPRWRERPTEEALASVSSFLDGHSDWVIDGNYSKLAYDRRMEEADQIFLLEFPRRVCLLRVLRRWRQYRGKTRPDMADQCPERANGEFLIWILWKGRTKQKRELWAALARQYPDKLVRLTRPKQVEALIRQFQKKEGIRHDLS